MNSTTPKLPLFNRIVIFCLGCLMAFGTSVAIFKGIWRNNLDLANLILAIVFGMFGCIAIWISVKWRNGPNPESEKQLRSMLAELPETCLVSNYFDGFRKVAIVIDSDAGLIHFENCFTFRRFTAVAQKSYTCPLSDLKAIYKYHYQGESLTIVTAEGKALLPHIANNYNQLRNALLELVPHNAPGYSADHPVIAMVYLGAALVGLAGGLYAAPRNCNGSTLGLFILGGAAIGVAISHAAISLADKHLKVGPVKPLGFGVAGATIGIAISAIAGAAIAWPPIFIFVSTVLGGLAGIAYGIARQR